MGGVPWTKEEDDILKKCIHLYGEGKWHRLPLLSGLKRCRKSCRLRWLNYLRPNIRRGSFSQDEVQLILKLHKLLGNRWTTIAERLAGRTANDVKNYWNCHLSKKLLNSDEEQGKQRTNEAAHPFTINAEQVESGIISDSAPKSCSVDEDESQKQEVPTMEFEYEQFKSSNANHWDWDDFLLDLDHI